MTLQDVKIFKGQFGPTYIFRKRAMHDLSQIRSLMYKFPFTVLFLMVWIASQSCQASPVPVKTTSHTFALHFVSRFKNGPVIPQMAMRVDFAVYPNHPSFRQYLGAGEGASPERTVAQYFQTLLDGRASITSETRASATQFYGEDERKRFADTLSSQIQGDYGAAKGLNDIKLLYRYDVNGLSIIYLGYLEEGKLQTLRYICVRQINHAFAITTYGTGAIERNRPLMFLIELNTGRLLTREPAWNNAPKPRYKYQTTLPDPIPSEVSVGHPLTILFNGQVSDALVNEKMIPADPTQAFVKHVVQTFRKGTQQQFLSLWTDYDIADEFEPQLKKNSQNKDSTPLELPEGLKLNWKQAQVRVVFTIDSGVESLVFLRINNERNLKVLVVWKQDKSKYQLSLYSYAGPRHESTLPYNLKFLLYSMPFQSYINDKAKQFIKQNQSDTDVHASTHG